MLKSDFSFYNNFATSIIIIDNEQKILFKNIQFLKNFGNVKNLKKFSNYFSSDICVLDSENLLESSPINLAIHSKESFTITVLYQKAKEQYSYYLITSFYADNYKIIAFKNLTSEMLYEDITKKYVQIKEQFSNLVEENKKYAQLQQKAQTQTIKLAILHKISNVIRESIDIEKILNSTLQELYNLFGAIKVYFIEENNKEYKIKNVYPYTFKNNINKSVEIETNIKNYILMKKIQISSCIRDITSKEDTFAQNVTRIIVPVYRLNQNLGLLVIYTNQKNIDETQNDVLQSIATQLATAIVQASLFQQLKIKNKELENTLTELKETQIQLINSEKMASLGQLVAGVAHEINTPLASINANNGILTTLIKKLEKNENIQDIIEKIENINNIDKEAIKRISNIVQSLKKFVRLDEADLQYADINKELDLTLDLIKHETKNRIEIIKNYSNLPQIKCYPNMLNQVFMNILINACQSIENKGEITITTQNVANNLVVKIKDTGSGIDEKIKDKMFIAGTTTKKIGIGTGLGLAISHKIIKKHNGNITFNSKKGKGTEFIIEIPLIQPIN